MQKSRQFLFVAQLGVIASLPFHFLINTYAIVLLIVALLYNFKEKQFRSQVWTQFRKNRIAQLFILLFALYPLSFLIHLADYPDLHSGLAEIEKKLAYLLFPILFASVGMLEKKYIVLLFKVFVMAVVVSTLLALMLGTYHTISSGSLYYYDPDKQVIFNNFMYHRLGSYVGMHAVYLAEYVLFSLAIVVHYSIQKFNLWNRNKKLGSLALMAYLILIIFLLKSAAILLILLAALLVFIIYYLSKYRNSISRKAKMLIPLTGIIVIIVLGMRAYEKIGVKAEYFSYDLSEPGGGNWNAINLRLAKWDATMLAIRDNWLAGVGPGNTERAMDEIYRKIGFGYALQLHYNPHNQFLHTFLALGIIGFATLLLLIINLYRQSFAKHDLVFMVFLVSLTLFSISESTLAVNKGIIFFAVFSLIFSYLPNKLSFYVR